MQAVRLECQDVHPRYNVPEESLASPVLCDDHAAHVARSAVRVRIQGISDFLQGSRRLHDDKLDTTSALGCNKASTFTLVDAKGKHGESKMSGFCSMTRDSDAIERTAKTSSSPSPPP
eukprot:767499-Hanusia_phi.AAC.2